MKYKLKLIRGRSYIGYGIKASAKKPFVIVASKRVVDFLVACKRFELVETITPAEPEDDTPPENITPPGENTPPSSEYPRIEAPNEKWTVGQLQAFAGDNGIPLEGTRLKPDILERIQTALAAKGDENSGIDFTKTP